MGHDTFTTAPDAETTPPLPVQVAALVRDLIFASKIRGCGIPVRLVRDPSQLAGVAAQRLLVDLNMPQALEAAVAWRDEAAAGDRRTLVGFVAHVDRATIDRARQAGFDAVLPRSQFVQLLPRLLGGDLTI